MIIRLYHADKTVRQELAEALASRNGFVLATQLQGPRGANLEARPPFREILECCGSDLDLIVLIDEGKPEGMWRDPFGELCDRLFREKRDASAATAGWVLLRAGQPMAWFRKALWDPLIDAEEITDYLSRAAPRLFRAFERAQPQDDRPVAPTRPKKTPIINPAVSGSAARRKRRDTPYTAAPPPSPSSEDAPSPEPEIDPWLVLGIHRGAQLDEVKKAWRALVVQYHPDKVAHLAPEFRKLAEERTRELNIAWEMLEKELG